MLALSDSQLPSVRVRKLALGSLNCASRNFTRGTKEHQTPTFSTRDKKVIGRSARCPLRLEAVLPVKSQAHA
eukprot:5094900-Amphidinium_carterae.1